MEELNCAFQYALRNGTIIKDTGLITKSHALALLKAHLQDFRDQFEKGAGPEMAIWCDMDHDGDYHRMLEHLHHEDVTVIDGVLYKLVRIGDGVKA